MKKIFFPVLAAFGLSLWLCGPGRAMAASAQLETRSGIEVLHVYGTPYEMGFQHGSAFKDRIQKLVKNFLGTYVYPRTRNKGYLWDKTQAMLPTIPKHLLEEVRGVADGAGVSQEEILMAHTYVDVLTRLGCSFLGAGSEATAGGKLVTARNLDWTVDKDLQASAVVVVYHPTGGQAFLSFTYNGLVGVISGVNESGQMVEINLSPNLENSWSGQPMLFTLRTALESAKTLAETEEAITGQACMAGFNIQIGSGPENKAKTLELSAKRVNVVEQKGGLLITTNHFTDPQMYMKNIPYFNSKDRYMALRLASEESRGKIDAEAAKKLIHATGVKLEKTVHSFVWAPAADLFSVWALDKSQGWADLKLSELFKRPAAKSAPGG